MCEIKDIISANIANRLGGLGFGGPEATYKFAEIKALKAQARRDHPNTELIDLGVGEPDRPADPEIVRVLSEEAGKSDNRFYADNGIKEFKEAAARFLQDFYGVTGLDVDENIVHSIGSKSALALLPLCFIDPGDVMIETIPGYPISGTWTKYLGGETFGLPLLKKNDFYPDLETIPEDILRRTKLLYINYPNNPTGQTATRDFYKNIIEFAFRNNIVVIADSAYSALTFDGSPPLSFLSVDGAKEVGVEIHSLSKSFNMTGWRLGFVAGNGKVIKALSRIKDNADSGQFRAIQKAGIEALKRSDIIMENRTRYSRRFDMMVQALNRAGFDAAKPKGTFYCYVEAFKRAKGGRSFKTAAECAEFLIKEAMISTVPWDDAGAFLRFSVTFEASDEKDEIRVMNETESRLTGLELEF